MIRIPIFRVPTFRLLASMALAAVLIGAPTRHLAPEARGAAGAVLAVADVCEAMMANIARHNVSLTSESARPRAVAEMNRVIDVGYNAIRRILKVTDRRNDRGVAGDKALGFARLGAAAAGLSMNAASKAAPGMMPALPLVRELYFACKQTIKRDKPVYPASYPYSASQ